MDTDVNKMNIKHLRILLRMLDLNRPKLHILDDILLNFLRKKYLSVNIKNCIGIFINNTYFFIIKPKEIRSVIINVKKVLIYIFLLYTSYGIVLVQILYKK